MEPVWVYRCPICNSHYTLDTAEEINFSCCIDSRLVKINMENKDFKGGFKNERLYKKQSYKNS